MLLDSVVSVSRDGHVLWSGVQPDDAQLKTSSNDGVKRDVGSDSTLKGKSCSMKYKPVTKFGFWRAVSWMTD
jgi:hypothetical protein